MTKFQIFVSYSQLAVFEPSLSKPLNNWTSKHVAQGFAWRPGSVSFRTLSESEVYDVELLSDGIEVPVLPSAIRVIEVPFLVSNKGSIEIASISDGRRFALPQGSYKLRFEALPGSAIRLIFTKSKEPRFNILRADSGLAPTIPLLETAKPA